MSKTLVFIIGIITGIVFASSYPDIAIKINEGLAYVLTPLYEIVKDKLGSILN